MTELKLRRGLQALALTVVACLIAGCGGGGGSSSSTTAYTQNVQPIVVDAGPTNNDANVGFISVTICVSGTSNCQTIDHIDVDTGSSGLRIISSVLSPSLGLTQQTDANGQPLAECLPFADGFVWGSVKTGDLTISGEQAKSMAIHVIGDPNFPNVPSDCSGSGPNESTVATFGANGIIGVGNMQADCGSVCADNAIPGAYYVCPVTGCIATAVATNAQVQNPVSLFPVDNNGVVVQMASIPASGAATAGGSLIFGIGTQTNNQLGAAAVLNVDPTTFNLTAVVSGIQYPESYLDSGSSAYFLPPNFAAPCTDPNFAGYFCPAVTLSFSATMQGSSNGVSAAAPFSVANAESLFNGQPTFTAFNDVAAINAIDDSVDLGLPFFYGRSIFTAIENKQTPGGTGPYVAF
jgi:hypothetical protein